MTELGCSSSSDRGRRASAAAFLVSSWRAPFSADETPVDHREIDGGALLSTPSTMFFPSLEMSESSLSMPVSSISVDPPPLEIVVTGEGPAMSLGLVTSGDDWLGA